MDVVVAPSAASISKAPSPVAKSLVLFHTHLSAMLNCDILISNSFCCPKYNNNNNNNKEVSFRPSYDATYGWVWSGVGAYEDLGLLRGEGGALLADGEVAVELDDALVEAGGHAQLAQVGLHRVRKVGERSGRQLHRLRRHEARSRVVALRVVLEEPVCVID